MENKPSFSPFSFCDTELLYHSRTHLLRSYERAHVFLKREDESGFGISGCKKRKYASLIPFLEKSDFEQVGIIGGASSNNVIGLVQLLREKNIPFHLFLKENHTDAHKGNAFFLKLLTNPEEITYISSKEWPLVQEISERHLQQNYQHYFVVPEGSSCKEAVPGALTLAYDIVENQRLSKMEYDHIFIDSGTALTAIALGYGGLMAGLKASMHVVRMAGDEAWFHEQVKLVQEWLLLLGCNGFQTPTFHLYKPFTAKSFGSVNETIRQQVKYLAKQHGILTDPVYSAKHIATSMLIVENERLTGNILVVHSGGGTGLTGWEID
ncbi:MAG: pyridoxal-phosphate dependent enzyme [Chitinophagales bacterium]|nr:pyridoxal-phosphate dependent enzyme [Chitinophagales bacterium]